MKFGSALMQPQEFSCEGGNCSIPMFCRFMVFITRTTIDRDFVFLRPGWIMAPLFDSWTTILTLTAFV
jgi:hypothetical protein